MPFVTEAPTLSAEWLSWLRNYAATARRFVEEEPAAVASEEERELVAVKAALYARTLTLFEGAILLIENDRQLDFRIQSRGVVEATMYLIALDRSPAFLDKMKDDDYKSRQSRAELYLKAKTFNGSDDVRKLLEDFLAQGLQGAKAIQISTLLDGSEFDRLYRSYRDISGDAAHVSLTALNRHYIDNPAGQLPVLILHPALDEIEMHMTVTELGISVTISTLLLMKIKTKTDLWDDFRELTQQYKELAQVTRPPIEEASAS